MPPRVALYRLVSATYHSTRWHLGKGNGKLVTVKDGRLDTLSIRVLSEQLSFLANLGLCLEVHSMNQRAMAWCSV